MKLFKPKSDVFFALFNEAALNVNAGAELFYSLTNDYTKLAEIVRELKEIEHKGDRITHDIIHRLNKSFITPLDREDIIAIASRLDSVIDVIHGTADRMLIYRIRRIDKPLVTMTELLVQATKAVCQAFELLPSGKHSEILPHCVEINRIEDIADAINRQAIGELLDNDAMNTLEVIKLKEIYEHLEDCIDLCEDLADILEGVVIKNA
jgi:predicted phosphate transport protein (TIGR00153 family)